jgi:pimeloyl-ACP methyl ester carboxylesterase
MTTTQSIELLVAPGVSVFGELAEVERGNGTVLLLHDRGSDLDSVRAFAEALWSIQLDTLLLDLPGHGLSAGDWDVHGPQALELATAACSARSLATGVIAVGDATTLLFGIERPAVHAVALVQPRLTTPDLELADSWRRVPQISMGDPRDELAQQSMDDLRDWVRAWSLRMHGHYAFDDADDHSRWTDQMRRSSAAFIAEQLAYRNNAGDVGALSAPLGAGQDER